MRSEYEQIKKQQYNINKHIDGVVLIDTGNDVLQHITNKITSACRKKLTEIHQGVAQQVLQLTM